MENNRLVGWLLRVCSHKLLKPSATPAREVNLCKFHIHIMFGLQVINTIMSLEGERVHDIDFFASSTACFLLTSPCILSEAKIFLEIIGGAGWGGNSFKLP